MRHKGEALSNTINPYRRDSKEFPLSHFMHTHGEKVRQEHSKKSASQEEFSPGTKSASLDNYEKINF